MSNDRLKLINKDCRYPCSRSEYTKIVGQLREERVSTVLEHIFPSQLGFKVIRHSVNGNGTDVLIKLRDCLLYTSPSPRDLSTSRMPSSA